MSDEAEAHPVPATVPAVPTPWPADRSTSDLETLLSSLQRRMRDDSGAVEMLGTVAERIRFQEAKLAEHERRYLEEPDIVGIAKREARETAIALLESVGFDMDRPREMAIQMSWLLDLKKGIAGFMTAVVVAVGGFVLTLASSWITNSNWWPKK